MKYYLFVDNFRGFSDTCIPITDVNFLVGENSTGKTSVLGLLKLFSGPGFLMGRDFSDEHVSFGHFADISSATWPNVGLPVPKIRLCWYRERARDWSCAFAR